MLTELADQVKLPPVSDAEPDDESREQSVRLYLQGRAALAAGNANEAISLLTESAGKDPTQGEIWRELGDAQLRLGRRALAVSSYTQAARRGLNDSRIWLAIARDAQQRGDTARAASLLARAAQAPDLSSDAGLPPVVFSELGPVLASLGYLAAARDALITASTPPEGGAVNTNFRAELGEVFRRRASLLELAGDLNVRLGDTAEALTLYQQAGELASIDPSASLTRVVYAAVLLDRPRVGAEAVLSAIVRNAGLIEDRQRLLIEYLASSSTIGPALETALSLLPRDVEGVWTPTMRSSLVLARAAADPTQSVSLLRSHVAEYPADPLCVEDLLWRLAQAGGTAHASEALQLAQRHPELSLRLADVLFSAAHAMEATRLSLQRGARTPEQLLLRGAYNARLGRLSDAWEAVAPLLDKPPADARERGRTLSALWQLALNAGRFAEARKAADLLLSDGQIPDSFKLQGLAEAGDASELRRRAEQVDITALDPTSEDAIILATLLPGAGRAAEAETIFRALLERDRFDERGYQGLLALTIPGGPLASESKLEDTSRSLRAALPSSRLMRWLAAGELARAQLWDQAETTLLSLAQDAAPDPTLIRQLMETWEKQLGSDEAVRAGVLTRALASIDRLLQRYPESVFYLAAKARLIELSGDPAQAEAVLSQALTHSPEPGIARQREQLLRGSLGRGDEANASARVRLAPLPRSVEASLELAALLDTEQRRRESAQAIIEGVPADAPLSDAQKQQIQQRVGQQLASAAAAPGSTELADAALDLASHALKLGLTLRPEQHDAMLQLIATRRPEDVSGIVAAVREAMRRNPDNAVLLAVRTAERLGRSGFPASAPRVLRTLLPELNPKSPDLYRFLAYNLTARFGDIGDVQALLPLLDAPEAAAIVRELGVADTPPRTDDQASHVVEVLYTIASAATLSARPDFAAEIYRLLLTRDPNHAMSCNNLGYHLLEHGGDLIEVERLLNIAYKQRPEASSILDSMGWLRYRQNRLRDETDERGLVVRHGAISLLKRALEAPDSDGNAIIVDHLGDAFWAAGERAQALEHWEAARTAARRTVEELRSRKAADADRDGLDVFSVQLAEFQKVLDSSQSKLDAVERGENPAIAPRQIVP